MEVIRRLAERTSQHLKELVSSNAMISQPITVGERHVIPICELGMALGAGGGIGEAEGDSSSRGKGKGEGGGAGGGAKVRPVAVLIIDEQGVRLQKLGK